MILLSAYSDFMPPTRPLTFWQKTKIAFAVVFHKRTPLTAKILLGTGLFYDLMPFDFIPDFLPIIGELDDATLMIAAILFFLHVTKDLRKEMESRGDIIDIKPL
jgi:uncharacterized membrane protein YkvA (DUF1232 family)